MPTINIAPFDQASKKKLIEAVGDHGKAAGLEAAVKVLMKMVDHKRRVVGTNEIKDAASVLAEIAAELRRGAAAAIKALEQAT